MHMFRYLVRDMIIFLSRMNDDPFLISFTATIPNDNYQAGAAVGTANSFRRNNIDASALSPAVFIDPLIQGASFFSRVEVSVDGMEVTDAVLNERGFLYNKVHRTFTDSDRRKKLYGKDIKWISNSKDRTTTAAVAASNYFPARMNAAGDVQTHAAVQAVQARPVQMSEAMQYAVQSLTFDSTGATVVGTIACGFDGVWPLNQQNQALCAITGQENENKFLPPGCEISIRLQKRLPLEAGIEKSDVTDTSYFSSAVQTANTFKIAITGITLTYESMTVSSADLEQLKAKTHHYYFDAPILRIKYLLSGTNTDIVKVSIPPGSKFAYLCFVYEDQVVHNAACNSFLSSRLRFPPNLIDFKLDMPGRKGLLFEKGIQNMGVKEGYASESLRMYHADLVRRGLYDKPFDSFFPPQRPTTVGYDQAILVDFSFTEIKQETSLTMNLTYNNNYGPVRWAVNTFFIVQQCLTYNQKTKWEWKTVH
jgi:hypothetical protein